MRVDSFVVKPLAEEFRDLSVHQSYKKLLVDKLQSCFDFHVFLCQKNKKKEKKDLKKKSAVINDHFFRDQIH